MEYPTLQFGKTGTLSGLLRLASLAVAVTAAGCASTDSQPRPAGEGSSGYVASSSGQVVRSGSGECVRSGYWQPAHATQECDPALVAQAAPPAPEKPPEVASTEPAEPAPAAPAETAEGTDMPAAQVEAEPAPAAPERIYVGADAFFGFNQAELTPQARTALDRVAERADAAQEPNIRIVGHADQLGSEDYNFALSQRRAAAVHDYLLQQGVPATAVSVEARGESDPIVNCEGRQGESLIDCLQPNRRTEIELSAFEALEEEQR